MSLVNILGGAAAVVVSLGTIGGGAVYVERSLNAAQADAADKYVEKTEFVAYTTADRTSDLRTLIQNTVTTAAEVEPGEYKQSLCRQLAQAVSELCAINSEEAMCVDRAILERRAGCSG